MKLYREIFHYYLFQLVMQKTWEDTKSGQKCFMLYARSLYITWGGREYWIWNSFKDTRWDSGDIFHGNSCFVNCYFLMVVNCKLSLDLQWWKHRSSQTKPRMLAGCEGEIQNIRPFPWNFIRSCIWSQVDKRGIWLGTPYQAEIVPPWQSPGKAS